MCYRIAFLQEEHRAAQHTAKHVFSLSGSFIDLEPVVGTLPCDQTQTIRAHYILKVPAPGELKEFIFYYLVRVKPQIYLELISRQSGEWGQECKKYLCTTILLSHPGSLDS